MKNKRKVSAPRLAVIYTRSTRGSEDDIANQIATCVEFCSQARLIPAHVFMASGSAESADCKENLAKVLQFCLDEKNMVAALVVPSIDRITRDTEKFFAIRDQLKARGMSLFGRVALEI